MKQLEIKTKTYRFNKDFLIDITVSKGGIYESWIYLDGYGFKLYMFGTYAKTEEEFIELVITNIFDYINLYIETKNEMEERTLYDELAS